MSYNIYRIYQGERKRQLMRAGLSLKQAQEWCNDSETSSMTARKPKGCDNDDKQIKRWHDKQKHWFDSYQEAK